VQARFQPVKRDLVKDRIYREIREAIFAGRLPAGASLPELRLARDFGVSQATVREALAQLERDTLVIRTPARATRVIALTREDVAERLAVRAPLEEVACVLASERMSGAQFRELGLRCSRIAAARRDNDFFELFRADLRFHRYIWEMTGNRMLQRVLDQVVASLFAFGAVAASKELEDAAEAVPADAHQAIASAMEERNVAEIRRLMKSHGRRLWESMWP
jgi:DNA-binding GntR family transcriptional regulator